MIMEMNSNAASLTGQLMLLTFGLGLISALLIVGFGRKEKLDESGKFIKFMLRKLGYLTSFFLGVLFMSLIINILQPYDVQKWLGNYESAVIGETLTNERNLQDGKIPQNFIDWYYREMKKK